MTQQEETVETDIPKYLQLKNGKRTTPFMVYPLSDEDRTTITEAVKASTPLGQKPNNSAFIMTTVLEAIKAKEKK